MLEYGHTHKTTWPSNLIGLLVIHYEADINLCTEDVCHCQRKLLYPADHVHSYQLPAVKNVSIVALLPLSSLHSIINLVDNTLSIDNTVPSVYQKVSL